MMLRNMRQAGKVGRTAQTGRKKALGNLLKQKNPKKMLKQSIRENTSFQTSSSLKASFLLTTTTVNEAVRKD